MDSKLEFFHFDKKVPNDQRYYNAPNAKAWKGYAEDGPRRFYGIVGNLDDHKHLRRRASNWFKWLLFSFLFFIVTLGLYWVHAFLQQRKSNRKILTLFLNNGCKGESIILTASSGSENKRSDGKKVRSISFCDLKFKSENIQVQANDQVSYDESEET